MADDDEREGGGGRANEKTMKFKPIVVEERDGSQQFAPGFEAASTADAQEKG